MINNLRFGQLIPVTIKSPSNLNVPMSPSWERAASMIYNRMKHEGLNPTFVVPKNQYSHFTTKMCIDKDSVLSVEDPSILRSNLGILVGDEAKLAKSLGSLYNKPLLEHLQERDARLNIEI